jgi:hypothetical protein
MLNRQRQMRSAKNCSPKRTRDGEKKKLAGNVLFIDHLSRLEIYTSCYAMPNLLLLLLSVSDCFAVYSRIIYFLVSSSPPFARKCLHVVA